MADPLPRHPPIDSAVVKSPDPLIPFAGSKRLRRPSVRLGDIGDQSTAVVHEAHFRRPKKWKVSSSFAYASALPAPASARQLFKARPLTNLCHDEPQELSSSATADNGNLESRSHKGKGKSGVSLFDSRFLKPNWSFKDEDAAEGSELKPNCGEGAVADEYWEFDEFRLECSESPSDRRLSAPGNRDAEVDANDATEGEVPSEINGVDWNKKNRRQCWMEEDGIWSWLNQMGLGRYAPLFDMHEVDENVLPFLTLEDLKDMGINAVGSRRKMYHAIQKLR